MERFIQYFVPEKYVLDLALDKKGRKFQGEETIFGEVLGEFVRLHAVNMKIFGVRLNGADAEYKYKDDVLEIAAGAGKAEIQISYEGTINENMEGVYLSKYEYQGRTEEIVATQFESHYAREAFPCVDEPEAKATFEVSVKGDEDDLVLVNAPSPRMSTYLLAFAVGKFQGKTVTNAHGVEITTYCALNQELDSVDFANEIAAKSLEFYDDEFGVPYPLPKLTQVALPDFEAGAMENWGLVTYRESMLLVSSAATLSTKKTVALTVAHELSHQWFGDLVTMKWWDELWLNESFASVMEYFAVDHIHPEYKIFEEFFTGDCLSALRRDALLGVQSVHQDVSSPAEIGTLFDPSIVYSKGARLMLMLIRTVGWKKFCHGLKDYFEEFKYRNTVGDDLWGCIGRHAEFDVKKLMHSFIDQPGYPVISSRKKSGSSEYFALPKSEFAEIYQTRFLLDAPMKGASDWVIPEVLEDMSGHYILNLSEEEFSERLAKFDELTLEEKLRLLIDRSLICKTELVASASLVPLVEACAGEDSAAVWGILLTIINSLKVFFEFGSEEEKAFKKWVLKVILPRLSDIGLVSKEKDDENTLRLRSILLALDFYAENMQDLEVLAELYRTDFSKIDKEIRDDVLDAKIWTEPEVFEEYLRAYRETADPEIKFDLMLAMTLARDEKVLKKVMELLDDIETVKPQDQFHLFIFLYRNPRAQDLVFDWLEGHWEFVKKISGDKSLDNYPRYMANAIKTERQAERYKKFFELLSSDPALTRAVEMGEKEIQATLKLISEDRAEVVKAIS